MSLKLSPVAQEFIVVHATCLEGDRFQILQTLEERRRLVERRQDLTQAESRLLLNMIGDYQKAVQQGILPMAVPPTAEELLETITAQAREVAP